MREGNVPDDKSSKNLYFKGAIAEIKRWEKK